MRKATAIMMAILLASCCSRKAEAVVTYDRTSDTLATLTARSGRVLSSETVKEIVVMRPDSTGKLHVVARDVERTVTHETETADDSSRFTATAVKEETREETEVKSSEPSATSGRTAGIVIAVLWLSIVSLVLVLASYIYEKWKKSGN